LSRLGPWSPVSLEAGGGISCRRTYYYYYDYCCYYHKCCTPALLRVFRNFTMTGSMPYRQIFTQMYTIMRRFSVPQPIC